MADTITIEGADRIRVKLAFMDDPDGVAAGMQVAAVHVKGVIAVYPPALSWSTYKRTGNLGKSWTINRRKLGASVTNNVSYGPYVQGEKQTLQHAMTGWKTTEEVAESEKNTVIGLVLDAVNRVLNK